MGITGTDVAKGASDMILSDDNFATIVDAVREGRGIYENIRHTVGFLLGTNIGEVLIVLAAMVLWQVSPFLAIHLLWINLITDSLPAIALGMEPIRDDVMKQKPKPKEEGIFAHGFGIRILLQGVMFAALTMAGFVLAWNTTGELEGARTMAFMVLALSQTFHAFNMRSPLSLIRTGIFTNKTLNGATLISLSLVLLVLFVPPVRTAFGLIGLSGQLYGIGLVLALVPILVLELYKNTLGRKTH
jgi:Ca2+-transporting ATPase